MPEDREVLREVWDGRIPACFNLHQDDLYTLAVPDPCFLMLPRLSYLPLATEKVMKLQFLIIK
jgi:autophagy-related protein 5